MDTATKRRLIIKILIGLGMWLYALGGICLGRYLRPGMRLAPVMCTSECQRELQGCPLGRNKRDVKLPRTWDFVFPALFEAPTLLLGREYNPTTSKRVDYYRIRPVGWGPEYGSNYVYAPEEKNIAWVFSKALPGIWLIQLHIFQVWRQIITVTIYRDDYIFDHWEHDCTPCKPDSIIIRHYKGIVQPGRYKVTVQGAPIDHAMMYAVFYRCR